MGGGKCFRRRAAPLAAWLVHWWMLSSRPVYSWLASKEKCKFSALFLQHSFKSNYIVENTYDWLSDLPDFHVSLSPCKTLSFKQVKINQMCSQDVFCGYFLKRRFIGNLKACKLNRFEKHCEIGKTEWHYVHTQCFLLFLHWRQWQTTVRLKKSVLIRVMLDVATAHLQQFFRN